MATIIPFPKKASKPGKAVRSESSYSVQIRVQRNGKRFTNCRTFRTEFAARAWGKAMEKLLNEIEVRGE